MSGKKTSRKRFPLKDEKAIAEWLLKDYHPIQNPMYHGSANWAKQVLGFDVYPQVPIDKIAFDDFLQAKGFRKGKDIEWYAAAILRHHALILRHYADKAIPRLGRLEKEFDRLILKALKHQDTGRSAQTGRVKGTRAKKD